MAVGAKRRHILMQFLIEAMTLGTRGRSVGHHVGVVGARVMTAVAGWPTIIAPSSIVRRLRLFPGRRPLFGLYPANKASRGSIQSTHSRYE